MPDWSKVNFVMKSDMCEPPTFRGDGTEICTVYEWQEMMKTYLVKKGYKMPEQGHEIMERLMGRAKNLVKIGIRSNPLVNISRDPEVIFSILMRSSPLLHRCKIFIKPNLIRGRVAKTAG